MHRIFSSNSGEGERRLQRVIENCVYQLGLKPKSAVLLIGIVDVVFFVTRHQLRRYNDLLLSTAMVRDMICPPMSILIFLFRYQVRMQVTDLSGLLSTLQLRCKPHQEQQLKIRSIAPLRLKLPIWPLACYGSTPMQCPAFLCCFPCFQSAQGLAERWHSSYFEPI